MKECKKCGTTYDDSVKFCGECGEALVVIAEQPVVAPTKTKLDKRIELANILALAMMVIWLAKFVFWSIYFNFDYYDPGYWVCSELTNLVSCILMTALAILLAWNALLRFKRWREWKETDL